jgi:hypothetical protein
MTVSGNYMQLKVYAAGFLIKERWHISTHATSIYKNI